ncbi:MAG: class I SAM-dependent methyltransferase [Desulfobacterales bacterium]|nr:class I SAM-dependent methyltransferase [Desulfobacterales bacterium]
MACIICGSDSESIKFIYSDTEFYECTKCKLVRTLPFPQLGEIREHYKNKFEKGNYSTIHSSMDMYIYLYRTYIDLIKNYSGALSGKKILDVGCFTGDFLDLALKENAETYGIELQEDAAQISNKKHYGRILNCQFNDAAFDKTFDIVTLFGLIEHVTTPEILLENISSWMKSESLLIIQTPNAGSFWSSILGKFWPPYAPVEHIHYFSAKNIKQFLEKYNYTVLKVKPHIKKLSIEYVYTMFQNFGPEFYILLKPFYWVLPKFLKKLKLPFYGGEMLIVAKKN